MSETLHMPDEDRANIVARAQRRINEWNSKHGHGRSVESFLAHEHGEIILLRDLVVAIRSLEADKARLDWLDSANARLNAKYGTRYKWQVILNHNVARLMLGDMQVDLHDTDPNGLPSCRDAIDAARGNRLSSVVRGEDE